MNKYNILLSLVISLMSISTMAQFNTIGHNVFKNVIAKTSENMKDNVCELDRSGDINGAEGEVINTLHRSSDSSYCQINNIFVSYPLEKMKVTSPYGMRKDPMTGIYKKHNGVDLRARKAMVYSMFPGIVHKVGYDERSGNYVIIHHGEIAVSYCHLSKIQIIKGSRVHAHEIIGISGNTGRSTGEHLHVTCKMKGTYINPEIIFQYIRNILDSPENDKN